MDNLGAIGGPLLALALVALVGVRTAIRPADGRYLGLRAGQRRRDAVDPARHRHLTPGRGADDAAQVAIALYVVYNLAATLASVPAGRPVRRWLRRRRRLRRDREHAAVAPWPPTACAFRVRRLGRRAEPGQP